MKDSNILISLIIQIDKNEPFIDIEKCLKIYQTFLRNNFTFYEIILIPNSTDFLSREECELLIKSFLNIVVISPIESIDEDLGIRIGIENSIGEKVITCFYDTPLEDIEKIIFNKSNEILIGVFKNKRSRMIFRGKKILFNIYSNSNNIICLSRSHINIFLEKYNDDKTFIFVNDILKLPFKSSPLFLRSKARRMGFFFKILKSARILYNNHFLKIILALETLCFISVIFEFLNFKSKYFSEVDVISNSVFRLLTLSSIFLIIFLVSIKTLRKINKRNKPNYNFFRSNFNYHTKLNVE